MMNARIRTPQPVPFRSAAMGKVMERARLEAYSSAPLLITGECGTGKTNLAYFVHHEGTRGTNTCDVWTPHSSDLMDPYVSAFGGLSERSPLLTPMIGVFEACDGGTLIVDCLDALDAPQQELILNYLADSLLRRPGEARWRKGNVRLIVCHCMAVPGPLKGLVQRELIRKLEENNLHIPPLRERREDVEPLFKLFVSEAARDCGRGIVPTVTEDAIGFLTSLELSDNAWALRHAARAIVQHYPDHSIDRESLLIATREGLRPLS